MNTAHERDQSAAISTTPRAVISDAALPQVSFDSSTGVLSLPAPSPGSASAVCLGQEVVFHASHPALPGELFGRCDTVVGVLESVSLAPELITLGVRRGAAAAGSVEVTEFDIIQLRSGWSLEATSPALYLANMQALYDDSDFERERGALLSDLDDAESAGDAARVTSLKAEQEEFYARRSGELAEREAEHRRLLLDFQRLTAQMAS